MKKQRLVLAGNGMAGIRCIEEIVKLNRHMFEIVIFGSEPHPTTIAFSYPLYCRVKRHSMTLH